MGYSRTGAAGWDRGTYLEEIKGLSWENPLTFNKNWQESAYMESLSTTSPP
jgi:hypothetical protein